MKDKIANQLVESSLISQQQLELALTEQTKSGGSLGYNLVKTGAISEKAFAEFLSQTYNAPAVDLDELEADEHSIELIPPEVATKFQVVPIKREGRILTVAMANPTDQVLLQELRFITRFDLFPVFAGEFTAARKAFVRAFKTVHHQHRPVIHNNSLADFET